MRSREVMRTVVRALSFRQLINLGAWLQGLIETAERAGARELVAEYTVSRGDPTRGLRNWKVVS